MIHTLILTANMIYSISYFSPSAPLHPLRKLGRHQGKIIRITSHTIPYLCQLRGRF